MKPTGLVFRTIIANSMCPMGALCTGLGKSGVAATREKRHWVPNGKNRYTQRYGAGKLAQGRARSRS